MKKLKTENWKPKTESQKLKITQAHSTGLFQWIIKLAHEILTENRKLKTKNWKSRRLIPLDHPTGSSHWLMRKLKTENWKPKTKNQKLKGKNWKSHSLIPLAHFTGSCHFLIPLAHEKTENQKLKTASQPPPPLPSISRVKQMEILGVTIQDNLGMDAHTRAVVGSACQNL